jgi:hypothetical protein
VVASSHDLSLAVRVKRAILSAAENGRKAGEVVMKTLFLALALMLMLLAGSFAGPNKGVILGVHGNVGGIDTNGDPCTAIALPWTCWELVPTATPDGNGVEWFLIVAVREPEELAFNTITFGIGDFDAEVCYISMYGPCFSEFSPLEIPTDDWPGVTSGTSVSWAPECLTGNIVPVYYFGIYVYAPGAIPLGPFYPGQDENLVSCNEPPEEDAIWAYGEIGCGGYPVDPLVCDEPLVMQTTWGQIKAVYR